MPGKSEFLSSAGLSFTLWHWAPGWSPSGSFLGVRVIVRNKVGTKVHFFKCVWNEQVQPHPQIKHGSRQIMLSAAALLVVISLLLINHYFAVYCTFSEHNWSRVDLWSPANTHTAAANVNKKRCMLPKNSSKTTPPEQAQKWTTESLNTRLTGVKRTRPQTSMYVGEYWAHRSHKDIEFADVPYNIDNDII